MLRIIVIIFFLASSCEEQALRDQSRPSDEGADVPGFLDETTRSVKAKDSATITIGKTTITIPEEGLAEDAEVRLRTLKSIPVREEVASLGEAKGDVVEVTMYNKGTDEIYASTVLDQPYSASQVLTNVSDEANLKYVVISAPGTEGELVQVLSRKAITTSAALTAADLTALIELSATHVIFYAVESAEVSGTVIILDSGKDTSNDSGDSISTSSSSSSSTSSSSGGSSIDCSGKGFDPENEDWIPVPANADVGQSEDFCVMKYEAKQDASGKPVSKPSGTPWVEISQTDAIAKCASLGEGVYKLITNEAWQTIARNIETAQSPPGTYLNWSGGSIAETSALNRGHSDNIPGDICDGQVENVGSDCATSDNSAPHSQKRFHTLSNGQTVWDIAGNASEWVLGINNSSQGPHVRVRDMILNANYDSEKWGPEMDHSSKTSDSESAGLGFAYLNWAGGVIMRGGSVSDTIDSGVFTTNLKFGENSIDTGIGFRCIATSTP